MAWEIRVWHEEAGDRSRLIIDASTDVPDEVISAVAGSYWLDEVQYPEEVWEESDLEGAPGPFHG